MAIIGTAGRGDDKDWLTHDHYQRMIEATIKLCQHFKIDLTQSQLVSGGAAWADHLVVTAALLRFVDPVNVTLYFPTPLGADGYLGDNKQTEKTADTANYYHKLFSQRTGFDSVKQLHAIQTDGAHCVPGNGSFHARNSLVAQAVGTDGVLIAFTFGGEIITQPEWTVREALPDATAKISGLKDGGTADTWNKAKCRKFHCRLGKHL